MTILKTAMARLMRSFGSSAPAEDPRIERRLETLARDCPAAPPTERKAIFRR